MNDHLHQQAQVVAGGIKELREENLVLAEKLSQTERDLDAKEAQYQLLLQEFSRVQHQADFYMKYAVTLTTQLSTIQDMIDKVCTEAQAGAYAPGTTPRPEVAKAAEEAIGQAIKEPIPKFLQGGPKIVEEPSAITKLKRLV